MTDGLWSVRAPCFLCLFAFAGDLLAEPTSHPIITLAERYSAYRRRCCAGLICHLSVVGQAQRCKHASKSENFIKMSCFQTSLCYLRTGEQTLREEHDHEQKISRYGNSLPVPE